MGDKERRREGVIVPEPWTQGAECAMKLLGDSALVFCLAAAATAAAVAAEQGGHSRGMPALRHAPPGV